MQTIELKPPTEMAAAARAAEIAAILAAAIMRTHRESDLGLPADQRVHTTPYQEEKL